MHNLPIADSDSLGERAALSIELAGFVGAFLTIGCG